MYKIYSKDSIDILLKYYNKTKDSTGIAYTYVAALNTVGNTYKQQIEILKKLIVLSIYISKHSERNYYEFYKRTVVNYGNDKYSNQKSIEACDKIIAFAKKNNFKDLEFGAMYDKIYLLTSLHEAKKQKVELHKKLLEFKEIALNDTGYISIQFNNYMGRYLLDNKQYYKALPYFMTSLRISKYRKDTYFTINNLIFIAKTSRYLKKNKVAFVSLKEAESLSSVINSLDYLRWTYEEFALNYQAINNNQQANKYWRKYAKKIQEIKIYSINNPTLSNLNMYFIENELHAENKNLKLSIALAKKEVELKNFFIISAIASLSFLISIVFYITKSHKQKLIILQKEKELAVISGQEEERENISRELHDSVGNSLVAIKALLPYDIPNYPQIIEMLDFVYSNIRTMSHILNSDNIKAVGLPESCEDFINLIDTHKKISMKTYGVARAISVEKSIIIFRIIQELLSNALKHAHADKIELNIFYHENQIYISIIDNGIGIDKTKNTKGIGLKNIQKRLQNINGTLNIDSDINSGSHFQITINIQ